MSAAKNKVHEAIEKMDARRRTLVFTWSQKVQEIHTRDDLSEVDKLGLHNRNKKAPTVKEFVVRLNAPLKLRLWDERSWQERGALSALTLGFVALGGQGTDIAAMGGALGVPPHLLTTAGGAYLERSFRN